MFFFFCSHIFGSFSIFGHANVYFRYKCSIFGFLVTIFVLLIFMHSIFLRQTSFKNFKLLVSTEICYRNQFESVELNKFLLFCFQRKTPFFGKFNPKYQNCQFKLKFGTYANSNMQNSMVIFNFTENPLFGHIWFKKSKLSVSAEIWYLDYFEYAKRCGGVQFLCFRQEKKNISG